MKKITSLFLALCLVLSLAGCMNAPAEAAEAAAAPAAASSEPGGASAEPAGGAPGNAGGTATAAVPDEAVIRTDDKAPESFTLPAFEAEDLGDISVAAGETWTLEDNAIVGKLELAEDAVVEADFPVIVYFAESDSVENGEVRGNVQFMNAYDEVVAIVHTNDEHGELDIYALVKAYADELKASGNYSLVLTTNLGDVFAGGNAVAHYYNGEFIPAIMAKVYDYMTWGNNDGGAIFPDGKRSYGIQTYLLAALGESAGMTTLLANMQASEPIDLVAYTDTYEPAIGAELLAELYPALSVTSEHRLDWSGIDLENYTLDTGDNALTDAALVETANGTTIGIYGIATSGGSITDAHFTGLSSTGTSQLCADELRAAGADAVVGICHTGWFDRTETGYSTEASSNDTNSTQLALKTTGIDVILDAHTHSVIAGGEGMLVYENELAPIINQAACKGQAIGVMYIYLNEGQVVAKDAENITDFSGITPNPEVQALIDIAYGRLAEDGLAEPVAESEYYLNGCRISDGDVGGGVRANETNLGDLVADGILYEAQKLWQGDEISIALYPGFWVRSSVEAGPIDVSAAMSVFANPLYIYYKSLTAAELLSEMNTSVSKIGSENNNMYQVAGLRCTHSGGKVVDLWVGEEQIVAGGAVIVSDDWTVGCAAAQCGGDTENYDEATVIIRNNTEMAIAWCDFLAEADYTIYPNEIAAGGRVLPAE